MTRTPERPPLEDRKPAQAARKKPFAGRKALISTMLEDMRDKGHFSQTEDNSLLVTGRSDARTARELSRLLGASVSIVSAQNLRDSVGKDEADRFIAETEGRKR